jgi:hypothetical protein
VLSPWRLSRERETAGFVCSRLPSDLPGAFAASSR